MHVAGRQTHVGARGEDLRNASRFPKSSHHAHPAGQGRVVREDHRGRRVREFVRKPLQNGLGDRAPMSAGLERIQKEEPDAAHPDRLVQPVAAPEVAEVPGEDPPHGFAPVVVPGRKRTGIPAASKIEKASAT